MRPDLRLLTEAALDHAHAGRAHEAHELWEAAWRALPEGEDRALLRGLIQRCAAAINAERGHHAAAQRQADRAAPRLLPLAAYADELGLAEPIPDLAHDVHLQRPDWPGSTREATVGCAAVLVAGGHGRRAGGPKALKPMAGQPLWRWQAARMRDVGCAPVAAVLHPSAVQPAGGDVLTVAADPDAEMLASLQAGLRALSESRPTPTFMLPVDCPAPSRAVWVALAAEAHAADLMGQRWAALRPSVHTPEGPRRGHPVLLAPALLPALIGADPRTGRLDRLLAAQPPGAVRDVLVDDPAIRANLNQVSDYAAASAGGVDAPAGET